MKRILILCAAILLFCASAHAAGTVTQAISSSYDEETYTITLTCTADASAATVPATALDATTMARMKKLGLYLYEIKTSPGGTAPTDASDFTLTDSNGLDIIGGAGTDGIDATSYLRFLPKNTSGAYAYWPVTDTSVTLTVTNNAVNSAVFYIELVFVK